MSCKENIGKILLFVVFIIVVLGVAVSNLSYVYPMQLAIMFMQGSSKEEGQTQIFGYTVDAVSVDDIKESYSDNLPMKGFWIEMSGLVTNALEMQNYYCDSNVYITQSDYIVSKTDYTTTDYEYEQTVQLKEYLDSKGIDFLYVNAPTKYLDDSLFVDEFSLETYTNRNADTFLQRLEESDVPYLDLRDAIVQEELDIQEMFYSTDHHWTTRSGLWATKKIVSELNQNYDFNIPDELYQEDQFSYQDYEDVWLGEQGVKASSNRVGLDDFCMIVPKYETSFVVQSPYYPSLQDGVEATFQNFINTSGYTSLESVYNKDSLHYSYLPWNTNLTTIYNNNCKKGKVLLIGDSFSQTFMPFFSLGVQKVSMINMRLFDGDLRESLERNDFDMVIVLYTEAMIGAHDDSMNDNYKMFQFIE